jgi:hypothetical protein
MASEEEMVRQVRGEIHRLEAAWFELYTSDGPNSSTANDKLEDDMDHNPPGLRHFVSDIISEVCSGINVRIDTLVESGELEPGADAFNFAINAFASTMRMVTCRMYEIGQYLSDELPYHSLVPCRCKSFASEVEDFLSAPFKVEGEGFLILNFDKTKATKMQGKAYWL